jgi:hypothetical protein
MSLAAPPVRPLLHQVFCTFLFPSTYEFMQPVTLALAEGGWLLFF